MSFKSFISSNKPGKGLYIFVWFAAWVPANIVVMLVDATLARSIIKSFDDFIDGWLEKRPRDDIIQYYGDWPEPRVPGYRKPFWGQLV